MDTPPEIVIATDGSALRNPNGPAGWCWFADLDCWGAGGWDRNTNNAAELTAILEALRATAHLPAVPLLVESDSQYAISCCTKWLPGWKRRGWRTAQGAPVKNAAIIRAIDEQLRGRTVRFQWVRGHCGHRRNEYADNRAVSASRSLAAGRTVDPGPGWTRT